jgi:hypothetical protein
MAHFRRAMAAGSRPSYFHTLTLSLIVAEISSSTGFQGQLSRGQSPPRPSLKINDDQADAAVAPISMGRFVQIVLNLLDKALHFAEGPTAHSAISMVEFA